MKKPMKIGKRVIDMDENLAPEALVKKFNQTFDELGHILVDRGNEIEALKLCLLSRSHLMLDGLHGTSKSKFATEAFRRIDGATVFKKQFMKGTVADEIFGPMNAERYRRDAIWEYNTTGMLPEAHFAFLDEVYRASDLLLPSMMGILNEREFINGTVVMQCPLITAIGTTNFVSDEEDLDAFRDRFLVCAKVMPLDKGASRLKMINSFLAKTKSSPSVISLDELVQLQKLASMIKFEEDELSMYEELVSRYRRTLGPKHYISDRRYCETLRLLQSFHIIQDEGTERNIFEPEHFIAASYGLCRLNDTAETDAFQQAFQAVIGNFVQEKKDIDDMNTLLTALGDMRVSAMSAKINSSKLRDYFKQAKRVLESLEATPLSDQPSTVKGKELFQEASQAARDLVNDISNKAGVTV
jgi:MoxR-like ATPase